MNNATAKNILQLRPSAKKLIVLDTSVLLHDPDSLFNFQEHDLFICRQVFRELDKYKKGDDDVARNSRLVSRLIDDLFKNDKALLRSGVSLIEKSGGKATGTLFTQREDLKFPIPNNLATDGDRAIIMTACALRKKYSQSVYSSVELVSKDILLRHIANCFEKGNITVDDYKTDKITLKDRDVLPTGFHELPVDMWESFNILRHERHNDKTGQPEMWEVSGSIPNDIMVNEYLSIPVHTAKKSMHVIVQERTSDTMKVERITNYLSPEKSIWGVSARNVEQMYGMNHLINPDIKLSVVLGDAGSGKTIIALATGLQILSEKGSGEFSGIDKIIYVRKLVTFGGEKVGFLPGGLPEKIDPYMQALNDTMGAISTNAEKHNKFKEQQTSLFDDLVEMQSIAFISGRTFTNKYIIVDEAQNLTLREVQGLLTRAGEGTKFVFCGNLAQIETPFLDEWSSGLTNMVMRLRGQKLFGHVILQECIRSELAKLAVDYLSSTKRT